MDQIKDKNLIVKPRVKRLATLAFDVSFHEILGRVCRDGGFFVLGKQLRRDAPYNPGVEAPSPSHESENPFQNCRDHVIDTIQDYIGQSLVGVMSDRARSNYVKEMYKHFRNFQFTHEMINMEKKDNWRFNRLLGGRDAVQEYKQQAKAVYPRHNTIDVPIFLESVLDESIEELKIPVTFPFTDLDSSELMAAITQKATKLKTLKIDFRSLKQKTPIENVSPVITSLNLLEHLTSLSLHQLEKKHKSVLCLIGKSCPLLSTLIISGKKFKLDDFDVMSIFLGEADARLCAFGSGEYHHLRLPHKTLTPMCSTLRNLNLGKLDLVDSLVFALHHLPHLENLDGEWTCVAIKLLYDSYATENELAQPKRSKLEPVPPELEQHLPIVNRADWMRESLSLVKLDYAPAQNAEVLQAIGVMCPNLKEVHFHDHLPVSERCENDIRVKRIESESSDDRHHQVESSLLGWPQLESIALYCVHSKYVKVILKAFGPKLKRLSFQHVAYDFDLADLMPCVELETLLIKDVISYDEDEPPVKLDASLFLPKLKSLESEVCLGPHWTRLFEQKPGLTRVALCCCHVGTKGSSCSDWNNLPLMWPLLESFHALQCDDGLTLPMLQNIVHRLDVLKEISVPKRAKSNQKKLLPAILEDFRSRPIPIDLRFVEFTEDMYFHDECSFLKHLPKEKSSSEESADENDDVDMSVPDDSDSCEDSVDEEEGDVSGEEEEEEDHSSENDDDDDTSGSESDDNSDESVVSYCSSDSLDTF